MNEILQYGHGAMRYSHIFVGFAGLVLFWIPVCSPKGGRLHRLSGKIFACCALWVGLTGTIASAWALIDPLSFAASTGSTITEKNQAYIIERARFLFGFLGFLSIGTLSGLILGVACVWTKKNHEALRNVWVAGSLWLTVMYAAGLAAYGVWNLVLGWQGQHLLGNTNKYWVHVILGLVGVWGTWGDLQYVRGPASGRMAWFYKHMECMLGTGIAFYTAFLIFGVNRIVKLDLPGAWQLVPWILPTLIGLPLISWWVRMYKRKFGDDQSVVNS